MPTEQPALESTAAAVDWEVGNSTGERGAIHTSTPEEQSMG